ncbi:hypothetical protein RI129_004799 [Pyrocoelia pectoralis]|uniref:DUF8207 domain-containing protein n=1 Tax=Pyrocoelia pectoralis TaxID=417401 RepID=A0AAN7VDL2_9COLE
MDSKEIKLKRRIVQARKAIQQKYNSLKAKRFNKELDFVQTYKPLIEPLANIQKNFEQKYVVKSEKREEEESTTKRRPIIRSTPRTPTRMIRIPGITPLLPQFSRSPPRFLDTTVRPEEKEHPSTSSPSALLNLSEEFLEQYAPLPRVYVERMIRDTENAIDTTYGIHYNIDTDKWTMGNTPIDVQGEDLMVKGVRYKGTEGLYELIIMNAPDLSLITEQDEENYKQLLIDTNVARRSYDAGEQLRGSRRMKYTQIIKPLLTTTTGSGVFKEIGNRPIEYKYWNNVHELIRELEVLWSEKRAGNTGLVNDIISIVEELYEDGYIEKPTQSFFSKL